MFVQSEKKRKENEVPFQFFKINCYRIFKPSKDIVEILLSLELKELDN